MGSSIDDFLKKENIFEEAQAIKEVVAWQLAKAMKKKPVEPAAGSGTGRPACRN